MDYIYELGPLALASRLRRLLDKLQRDGRRAYKDLGLDFEVRWFSVFHFLISVSEASITQISQSLNLRHPTVIQVINEMMQNGLLKSAHDKSDRRRRQVSLTSKGRKLAMLLKPVWLAFDEAGQELATELGNDFIASLNKLESAIRRETPYARIQSRLRSNMKGD